MPFKIRPYRRFLVSCPVRYLVGRFQGHGTVWDVSRSGWQFSGNLPVRIGDVCSLTANLPTHRRVHVATGIVRWVRGEEYGVETLKMDDESQADLDEYLWQRESESDENIE